MKITALIGAEIVHIFRKIKQENVSNGFYLKDSRNLCMCFLKHLNTAGLTVTQQRKCFCSNETNSVCQVSVSLYKDNS